MHQFQRKARRWLKARLPGSLPSAHDDMLHTEIEGHLSSGVFDNLSSPSGREAMYRRITERVKQQEQRSAALHKWWRAAAAILLPIMLAGGWWYDGYQEKPVQHAAAGLKKNKVLLTLSDGASIELDSSGKGVVTLQGNTVSMKQGNGNLVYNALVNESNKMPWHKITTPKGETFLLTLPDGSTALLNAESSIRFPVAFPKEGRQVEVTGEVYFEIQKDRTPFRVKAPESEISVLGTKFNVNGYTDNNGLRVTLLEGAVKVAARADSVLLRPGQQAVLTAGKATVSRQADLEEVMAWKDGNFVFNSLTLPEIMRQVCRWYDVEVSYEGPVSAKRFTGIINRNESITEILDFMQAAGVRYKLNDRKIVVIQ
ncbi:FecR domain-containing protein [Chitinophaga oryzae]|uniref:FecR domain-containing protein n=1 Tax=Chitinophaga oryzae TaxID=2725414 RepID=A0ABX6LF69_9BACT|nr:FecR family protein [Chitinophaga oryzae]QJB38756.1 FecR domain-containing protein [Chitinophaga oryzae]